MVVIVPIVVLITFVYMVKSGYCCWTTYKDAKSAARSEVVVEQANQVEYHGPFHQVQSASEAFPEQPKLPQSMDPLKLPQPASNRGYITLVEAMNVNSAQPQEPSSRSTEMNESNLATSRLPVNTGYVSLSEILGNKDDEL